MKMIGSLVIKKMTKLETDTKRNKDMSVKVKGSQSPPGLFLKATRSTRKGVEVQLEIKRGKNTVKKIVNHVQTHRKTKDLMNTRTVIDQEDIVAHVTVVKLS